jgi:tRNA(Ile)-lysidine synthase
VVRPLLNCSRGEVIQYLAALRQDFRIDSSNASRDFMRNRIRAELMPLLRTDYSAGVDDAILRLAHQASEMHEFCEAQARKLLATANAATNDGEFTLRMTALHGLPAILVREALRIAWREARLPEQSMTHDWWCQLVDLAVGTASGAVLNLPGNIRAEIVAGLLLIRRGASTAAK